ncbi:hypothetical protein GCM10010919_11500 [Alishewanella longhuensis]|uniref:KfrA N-terminal DNA-binding domain-containing protein n=1 Tax=Alishewanella longhuensis TaxID=1091037 RepID=A0ABQ3KXC9_9ALTE|nr:hypothetical protein [Alishewanella longhuensis]GHG64716.1 hypothetical protein GCM10010919_11500 [Alishewanella longhuensis]
MASAIQLLQQVATKLRQEGKQPSLALFKARLAGQLSPPELFSAYQQWRQHPEQYLDVAVAEDLAISRPINAEQDLSSQLNRIEQKLDRLLHLLEQTHVSG